MSILENISKFGTSVYSGISNVLNRPSTVTTTNAGSMTTGGLNAPVSTSSDNPFTRLVDSAVSRISDWINPESPKAQSPSNPQNIYVLGSGGGTASGGNSPSFFGIPQSAFLIGAALLVGFIVYKKGLR